MWAFRLRQTSSTEGQTEAAAPLWTSQDGGISIGLWKCTPGRFTADRTGAGAYYHIIRGRATVRNRDGSKGA